MTNEEWTAAREWLARARQAANGGPGLSEEDLLDIIILLLKEYIKQGQAE